ncbi:MAG: methyl-accepting chemotaxis protein [Euryarchaeota archaeon]|nr:methyl-accepting chemotaxis protein [Euryarchaeota archaeon]
MKRLLNRLVVAGTEQDDAEATDDSGTSDSVEWTDLSTQPSGPHGSESGLDPSRSPIGDEQSAPDSDTVDTMAADRLLENVLNGLPEPTLVIDSSGVVSHINSNACSVFEVSESEALGAPPAAVHGGDPLAEGVLDAGEAITERRETIEIEGTERTLSRTITPFRDNSGEIVGAMETASDITEKAREERKTAQLEAYQELVISDLQDKLVRLAEGDLTLDSPVPEPDADFEAMITVYEQFTQLNAHLTTAVDNYQSVLSRLTLLADDLDDTSQELSANSEEVTASIEEISQSTEEIADGSQELAEQTDEAELAVSNLTATIEEITASVQEIDAETSEASKLAVDGVEEGTDAVDRIRSATDATSEITAEIRTLESQMEEVGEALDVISDIAEQTNLLALNASIEAARAGEEGDGFAVVADEVKSLAEKSKESAAAIETIITDAQDQTAEVADQIADTNEEVSEGADAVEAVVDQLDEIEAAVEGVSSATAEVSEAVENQAENMDGFSATIDSAASMSEELSTSVQQISAGLKQQSTATDQVAHRATNLSSTSEELYERIDQFRLAKDESADVDSIDQA